MRLLMERSGLKVWQIEDGKFSVTESVTTLNHFSPQGEPLGVGVSFVGGQKELALKMVKEVVAQRPKKCICDYPDGATVAQRADAEGHYNEAEGFCCPHHGNTCGHCTHHES